MAEIQIKNVDKADERRDFPRGHVEINKIGNVLLGRATFEPGWRWSESVKPIVGTDSCQVLHHTFFQSGRMRIRMDDGSEAEAGPGDFAVIQPGHDAWVVGDEPCIAFDFSSDAEQYAAPRPF
jgi:hypothetical protein